MTRRHPAMTLRRHHDPRRPVQAGILAVGLDGTVTDLGLATDAVAVTALAEARRMGVRTVLATGRGEEAFVSHPGLAQWFDGFVLEGGAVWGTPGQWHLTSHDVAGVLAVADAMSQAGFGGELRRASLTLPRTAEGLVQQLAVRPQVDVRPNHDHLDVTPAGVNKGVGLRALLEHWGARDLRVVAVGDGENDADLFAVADHAIAVANAALSLRTAADEVAPYPASQGVAWLVRERLAC